MVKLWREQRFGNIPKKHVFASVLVSGKGLKAIAEAVGPISDPGASSDTPRETSSTSAEWVLLPWEPVDLNKALEDHLGIDFTPSTDQMVVGVPRAVGHVVSTVKLFDFEEQLRGLFTRRTFKGFERPLRASKHVTPTGVKRILDLPITVVKK
jgi:hypothetical protein